MGIIAWIIVGLIGGAIARLFMRDPIGGGITGLLLTIVLGVAGALVGGFIAIALGISDGVDDFDIGTIVLAIAGSFLILAAYGLIDRSRAVTQ